MGLKPFYWPRISLNTLARRHTMLRTNLLSNCVTEAAINWLLWTNWTGTAGCPKETLTTSETSAGKSSLIRENYTLSQFDATSMLLLIHPRPNATTTAFIVGPQILARTLILPDIVLHTFVQRYRFNIGQRAREMMALYPPEKSTLPMCLCLLEVVTEVWKSIYIRTERKPNPLPLAWRPTADGGSGGWTVCEVPNSSTVVRGGFSSCQVRSRYVMSERFQ